jgi:transposase
MKTYSKTTKEYKLLKHSWRILLVSNSNNKNLGTILDINDELKSAHKVVNNFLNNYNKIDYLEAKDYISNLVKEMINLNIEEFRDSITSFTNWKEEIANSFIKLDSGKRISNGKIEGTNNKIKTLKKISYGITNFEHLRKRVFLLFDTP